MGKKYKSVEAMVKDLSSEKFYNKFISEIYAIGYLSCLASRKYLNLQTEFGLDLFVKNYQDKKIYLDEYEGQEKLREEYFALKRASYNFTVNNTETYWFESRFLTRR